MKKPYLILLIIFATILLVGFLIYKIISSYDFSPQKPNDALPESNQPSSGQSVEGGSFLPSLGQGTMEKPLEDKKIVMVVAFRDFRDEEYFVPKQIFLAAGVKTVLTASTQRGIAVGAEGGEAPVNILVKDIYVNDYDAIIFIGGPGAVKDLDNEDSYKVARNAFLQKKLVSAICVAPTILAKAGILEGKKATVWSSTTDKSAVDILEENGAVYQEKAVVRDGNVITGNRPEAADSFGMEIVDYLSQ